MSRPVALKILVAACLTAAWCVDAIGATYQLRSKIYAGTFDGFADRLTITAGDVDGDGDPDIIGGYAQGGLVYLRNQEAKLPVDPPSATVVAGDGINFTLQAARTNVTWRFVSNNSSGTLDAVSGCYTSGPTASVIDVVEAEDGAGIKGLAYVNVIGASDVSAAGKAVVIAGGKSLSDPVWRASDYLADHAYNTLRYRGYSRDNLHYLSFGPSNDVDGNGAADDIDAYSSLANVSNTLTAWAADAAKLFIYLTDHGGSSDGAGFFRLNGSELLTAGQLDAWLDALQDAGHMDVTVVIDCCYAGSFVDELTYSGAANRIVIAACSDSQLTYFLGGGLISFSDVFFNALLQGFDMNTAFELAADAMSSYQTAWLDDDGDGDFDGADGVLAATSVAGASFIVGRDFPTIGSVSPNQTLAGQTVADLWADDITAVYPVDRVWCAVIAPSHQPDTNSALPVVDVPEFELNYNSALSRYEARVEGFSQNGTYKLVYYAEDIWGGKSLPKQGLVTQTGFDERAIIIAGGETNAPGWKEINTLCRSMYNTLRQRQFDVDAIRCLNGKPAQDFDQDGTNDVHALPTRGAAAAAITNWAVDSSKLTVYLVGPESGGAVVLNATETLDAASLDAWLDAYQASNGMANVVLEFTSSGSYIPALAPPAGQKRVTVASTRASATSLWKAGGLVSFSQFFLSHVFQGQPVGQAFDYAFDAIRRSSRGRQVPLLDDDGDGIPQYASGGLADVTYIGPGFLTGDDVPYIGSAGPTGFVHGVDVTLWAADISDVDGISNVWCVITPPDFEVENELPQVSLTWNDGCARYEVQWNGFTNPGPYVLTFMAEDVLGTISIPNIVDAYATDGFEPDDTWSQASAFVMGTTQHHTFHASNDVDWVKFFAVTNVFSYDIETIHQGTNVDSVIDVYRLLPDGITLTNVVPTEDLNGTGLGAGEWTWVGFPQESGWYYVRVRHGNPADWGPGNAYDLRISTPTGAGELFVVVADKLNAEHCPPGATVYVHDGDAWQPHGLGGRNNTTFLMDSGGRWVWVPTPAGYMAEVDPYTPGQVDNPVSYEYGNPKWVDVDAWPWVIFQFYPVLRAEGDVRDALTGDRLEGVAVSFVGREDPLAGRVYDGHPGGASYRERWYTSTDGGFPTNVWLPTVDWDLHLDRAGYEPVVDAAAVVGVAPGDAISLGTYEMMPLDANHNGVADWWEARHFSGRLFDGTDDSDGDGLSDEEEYWCGTDPTNAASVLRVEGAHGNSNGFTLSWQTVPWRRYEVEAGTDLLSNDWPRVFGPRGATGGQYQMQWTDTNAAAMPMRFYRIGVVSP